MLVNLISITNFETKFAEVETIYMIYNDREGNFQKSGC